MPFPAPPHGPQTQKTGAQKEDGSGEGGGGILVLIEAACIVTAIISGNSIVLVTYEIATEKIIYIKVNVIFTAIA